MEGSTFVIITRLHVARCTFACVLAMIYYTDARLGFHTDRALADADLLFDSCEDEDEAYEIDPC